MLSAHFLRVGLCRTLKQRCRSKVLLVLRGLNGAIWMISVWWPKWATETDKVFNKKNGLIECEPEGAKQTDAERCRQTGYTILVGATTKNDVLLHTHTCETLHIQAKTWTNMRYTRHSVAISIRHQPKTSAQTLNWRCRTSRGIEDVIASVCHAIGNGGTVSTAFFAMALPLKKIAETHRINEIVWSNVLKIEWNDVNTNDFENCVVMLTCGYICICSSNWEP